jgi:hypothetical protein
LHETIASYARERSIFVSLFFASPKPIPIIIIIIMCSLSTILTNNFPHLNLLNSLQTLISFFESLEFCLRESVSKLVCDWEGLGGRGGEEVHDDSIKKNKEEKLRKRNHQEKRERKVQPST